MFVSRAFPFRASLPRMLALACIILPAVLPGSAAARYDVAPGFPWTYSISGTESASALKVDMKGWVWVVGNTVKPGTGRDVLAVVWSITSSGLPWSVTNNGVPLSSSEYDGAGVAAYGGEMDDGEPALAASARQPGSSPTEPEMFVVFTSTGDGSSSIVVWQIRGVVVSSTPWRYGFPGKCNTRGGGVAVLSTGTGNASGTPFITGTFEADGVEQMLYLRVVKSPPEVIKPSLVTATYWTGPGGGSISGRGIVNDGAGNSWVVAASQGTIWLFRYTAGSYEGNSVMDIKAVPVPGYPVKVTKMNNSYEDPGLVARDNLGNLWIAGTIDGTAALWKLDENGSLLPGFPLRSRGGLGAGLALNAIAVDPEGNCYATGASGNDLAVLGFDAQGTPLAGLPYYVSGAPGRLEGRGIDIAPGGSLWVAATAVSASASISFIRLYLLSFTTDPLPVAPGDVRVRGPGGGVLNILKGERVEILANPCEAGILRVQVLTPRGEAVRELTAYVSAGQFPGIAWDGRNTAGEKVADGVYMVRVTGGGLKAVRRVVVIRRK